MRNESVMGRRGFLRAASVTATAATVLAPIPEAAAAGASAASIAADPDQLFAAG